MHPFLPARDPARDPARLARAAPRGRHSKGARDGGAPHAAVGPGLTGTSPPVGKLHTRPGHVRECAVAVGDPELGLAVAFPCCCCDTFLLFCTVFHQSELEFSDLDQNLATNMPLLFKTPFSYGLKHSVPSLCFMIVQ